jgi:hypothetical protein
MTGERLQWFRVASHLRIPVAELRSRITYSEFTDWLIYLQREQEREIKYEYALAQIAAEVRRGNVMKPNRIKTMDFLIKIGAPEPLVSKSKQVWFAALNLPGKDN